MGNFGYRPHSRHQSNYNVSIGAGIVGTLGVSPTRVTKKGLGSHQITGCRESD